MNDISLEVLKSVLDCPSLELHLSSHWGSSQPEHRFKIRQFIAENVRACGGPDRTEDILDLEKVPALSNSQVSISHCLQYGVIAFAQNPVGVDVEELPRLQDKIVARMSNESEMSQAPSAASLWVAKEAAYKALKSFAQPQVLSQLEIGMWQALDSHSETFALLNHSTFAAPVGKGVVIRNKSHALAVFKFHL